MNTRIAYFWSRENGWEMRKVLEKNNATKYNEIWKALLSEFDGRLLAGWWRDLRGIVLMKYNSESEM